MIIMHLKGGLGNQMFQYALGRRLASERNDQLFLDLSWFFKNKARTYQLDIFQIQAEIAETEVVKKISLQGKIDLLSKINRKLRKLLPYYKRPVVIERKTGYDKNILKIPRDVILDGYWQSEKYFHTIRKILLDEFLLKSELSQTGKVFLEKIKNTPSVSIHVRRGDYLSDPMAKSFHGICGIDYYLSAMRLFYQSMRNPVFYIFSDDPLIAREMFEGKENINYVSDLGLENWEELYLMAFCQHNIIANSSYSWWGAWLGNNRDKKVVAPMKWFNATGVDTSTIIPERWIKI